VVAVSCTQFFIISMERENRKSGYDGSLETLRKEKGKKRERDKGKKQREERR